MLLGTGAGGLVASAAGGALVDRLGSRRSCVAGALALAVGLPAVASAGEPWVLAAVLAALGSVDVLTDIGMNVQAAQLQRQASGSVVHLFHGAWSLGALGGAAIAAAAAGAEISLGRQLAVTSLALVATIAVAARHLSRADDTVTAGPPGTRRTPVLALLAAVALAMAVVESVPGDWAAVFTSDVHGAGPGVASLGYLAVSAGMVAGRFTGDAATDRLGADRVFRGAIVVAVAGLVVVVTSPVAGVALAGFGIVGLGISVLFPALYLQAADTEGIPGGLGLGVLSTGARLGFLLSPPVVGALASAASLRTALAIVVGASALAASVLEAALARAGRTPQA